MFDFIFENWFPPGDGSVSAEEIKYLLKGIGEEITDEEISIMMSQTKLDEKGGLDYKGKYNNLIRSICC